MKCCGFVDIFRSDSLLFFVLGKENRRNNRLLEEAVSGSFLVRFPRCTREKCAHLSPITRRGRRPDGSLGSWLPNDRTRLVAINDMRRPAASREGAKNKKLLLLQHKRAHRTTGIDEKGGSDLQPVTSTSCWASICMQADVYILRQQTRTNVLSGGRWWNERIRVDKTNIIKQKLIHRLHVVILNSAPPRNYSARHKMGIESVFPPQKKKVIDRRQQQSQAA